MNFILKFFSLLDLEIELIESIEKCYSKIIDFNFFSSFDSGPMNHGH